MATNTDLVNFKIIQGDTFTLIVTCTNPDGTAIDLSTYDIQFKVNNDFGGNVVCATGNLTNGGVVGTDLTHGTFKISVSSKDFTIPKCAYQIKVAPAGANIDIDGTTVGRGYFSVEKGNI